MALKESQIVSYGAALAAGVGALLIFMNVKAYGITELIGGLLAGVGALLAVLFYKYGYVLLPIITQQTKTNTWIKNEYEIPPSQNVVIKKGESGLYYASIFLGIPIYESVVEKSTEEAIAYNQFFERAISNLKFVTKISYLLYVEDVNEKRKIIETRRAEAQLRLAREREKPEPDVLRIDRYEREVSKWSLELERLVKGIKPMGVVAYVMTTASGITSEAAIATARSQAQEIRATLSNA
ncbi:hypothetical protein KJ780_01650, partial [Candidatus Micrarchaeota archaeon]|nr:hypothetical protein [Candidatus Micrarchaeota archaeon]